MASNSKKASTRDGGLKPSSVFDLPGRNIYAEYSNSIINKEVPSLKEFSAEALARALCAPLGVPRGRLRTWLAHCPVPQHWRDATHHVFIKEMENGFVCECTQWHSDDEVRQAFIDQGHWPPEDKR